MTPRIAILLIAAHLLGLVSAILALLRTRTSQGTIAWIVSLLSFPLLAVPAYWLFGRSRFEGYVSVRRGAVRSLREELPTLEEEIRELRGDLPFAPGEITAIERLAQMPFLRGNRVRLLEEGAELYDHLLERMAQARKDLLVQFYIVQDDPSGARFAEVMKERARAGVRVRFLFDKVGSYRLSDSYLADLREAGVEVGSFESMRGFGLPSQINFRNHRKVVVVDGREGWVGGFNIGDEHLGLDPKLGPWRDTHLHVEGPGALGLQLSFLEDWHWVTDEVLSLDWSPHRAEEEGAPVLILPSGPADPLETAGLMMQHVAQMAKKRLWIATPYLVPDDGMIHALQLAVLRGVDVRILIPEKADSAAVHYAAFPVVSTLIASGIRVFRYEAGFMHAKTFLLDDVAAAVGTVNLDNRSFRLNFEITAIVADPGFAGRMEASFDRDLADSREVLPAEIANPSLPFRLLCRAASLLGPIL